MSRSVESLLERQFEAINETQAPVTMREILDRDRLIVAPDSETPRPAGVGSRIGLAAAVIAVMAITLVLAWYTSAVPQLDPAVSDGTVPQPTTPPTLSAPEREPTTPATADLVEPTIAGSAFDVGWTLEEHQLDISGLGDPRTLAVQKSVDLFWAQQNDSAQLWVSDDGTDWDPVGGGVDHEPSDLQDWTGFLRIENTIVVTHFDDMWISSDGGRSFTLIENQMFEELLFAWSWVADDAFWVITEHPDRTTLNTAESPNALDEGWVLDETKPRQLWTSRSGDSWTLIGDVSGLPPWAGSVGIRDFFHIGSWGIAADDHIVLMVKAPAFVDGKFSFPSNSLFRSTDEGLTWEPFADLPNWGATGTVDGWMYGGDLVTNDAVTWYTLGGPIQMELPSTEPGFRFIVKMPPP